MQFRQWRFQTDARKTLGNTRAQAGERLRVFVHGAPQDLAHFFLHAAAVALRTPLERVFQIIFKIAHDHLGHGTPLVTGCFQRMISRYRKVS